MFTETIRGSQETDMEGGLPKKEELGQFADLSGNLTRRRSGVFEGVDTLMHTMKDLASTLTKKLTDV